MDRSFLSQPEVIAASRKFVCIRLATYEDKEEAAFLKSLWVGRSGEVENTLFTILSPDGKRTLVHPSRSPRHEYEDAGAMAASLKRIAGEHELRKDAGEKTPPLPLVANVRLALDVAACDGRPLTGVSDFSSGQQPFALPRGTDEVDVQLNRYHIMIIGSY